MRIGVLTGGGDVPGLNPAIKAVVERATGAPLTAGPYLDYLRTKYAASTPSGARS